MRMPKKTLLWAPLTGMLLLSCTVIPPEARFNRGAPESLLDQSSEVVNFELSEYGSVDELTSWVSQDQPTRAEIYCEQGSSICSEAQQALQNFGVATVFVPSTENMVTLVYERVLARNCENRYIENGINPYNLPHPTLGCSTASNIVQMVTDKRQFTSPALLDFPDAERADRAMRGYRQPYNVTPPEINPNFETNLDIKTQSQ